MSNPTTYIILILNNLNKEIITILNKLNSHNKKYKFYRK